MSFLEITTKTRVKAKLQTSGTGLDTVLDALIQSVSDDAQRIMSRKLLVSTYTEVYPLRPRVRYLSLGTFPITAVSSVKYTDTRDFTGVDPLDTEEYQILLDEGQLYFSGFVTWLPVGFVQVTYTGGMAADTASFIAAYPRIADAADNEVIARYQRRERPDGNLVAMGTQMGFLKQLDTLNDFENALTPHRRLRL